MSSSLISPRNLVRFGALCALLPAGLVAGDEIPSSAPVASHISATAEPMDTGKFQPTWESLQQYECPEWFRDAKFGIWAHWGPQCQPEQGDWYGRFMYMPKVPSWAPPDFEFHRQMYGPQSKFGFKDVIHLWKAEQWDPGKLMALYKRAGAQYFFALANHHDNLDLWDSKYQPWNAVAVGPKKDLIGGWAQAARANGLRFGVSVHAAHAWTWYEPSQGADETGPLAGVPYDGKLIKADGKGQWWDGLDPQDLYAQNHPRSAGSSDPYAIHRQWNWDNGASLPDQAYCDKFYNRTVDLINKYQPDLIYFDDTALPLWPVSDAGLRIAAHFYNRNMKLHEGRLEAVMFAKVLDAQQRQCMVWDIERGQSNQIEPQPWQTDTCLGDWHYKRAIFEQHGYKTTKTVIHTLADVVSKNGNLLLNVPVRGDGTIDSDELAVVEGIARWMDVNRESIFGTRPWKVCGEGPALENAVPITAQGFNEGKGKPFTAEDVRFTTKGGVLYAIVLGWPKKELPIKSLGTAARLLEKPVTGVSLLGSEEKIQWSQTAAALTIAPPKKQPSDDAIVFKISFASLP
jgi:alpha-L-fucosidase